MDLDLSVLDVSPVNSGSNGLHALRNTLDLARLTAAYRSMQVMGDLSTVRTRIKELTGRTLADEVMVTTNVYDHAERLRSYEGLAAQPSRRRRPASRPTPTGTRQKGENMAEENPRQGSTRDSSDPHKVYPDRSVLGGEVGLWMEFGPERTARSPGQRGCSGDRGVGLRGAVVRRSPRKGGLHQRLDAPLRDEPPRGGDRHSQHLRP